MTKVQIENLLADAIQAVNAIVAPQPQVWQPSEQLEAARQALADARHSLAQSRAARAAAAAKGDKNGLRNAIVEQEIAEAALGRRKAELETVIEDEQRAISDLAASYEPARLQAKEAVPDLDLAGRLSEACQDAWARLHSPGLSLLLGAVTEASRRRLAEYAKELA